MVLHVSFLFLAAFGGSLHCLGMCGGFVATVNALSKRTTPRSLPLLGHLFYHGGRLTSYMFLGSLAGALGQILTHPSPFLHNLVDLIAGILILATGLRLLGFLPELGLVKLTGGEGLKRLLASLRRGRRFSTALYLGTFNGFIPCPLISAFIAQAASTSSALAGALTMAILVVGTAPGMILLGRIALSHEARGRAVKVSGALLALLGAMTFLHTFGFIPSPFWGHR